MSHQKNKKSALSKALNAAQRASGNMLRGAGKELSANKVKKGEAPLQHIKRLLK